MANELTAEEKAFFESGGATPLPDDYASDARQASQQAETGEQEQQTEQNSEEQTGNDGAHQNAGEQEGEGGEGQAQTGERDHKVPLAEFMKEKKARQEMQRKLDEIQQRYSTTEERMNLILQAQQQNRQQQPAQQEQRPQIPDAEADPIEALKWMQQQMLGDQQQRAQYRHYQEQQAQQQHVANQVVEAYRQAATEYAEVEPDFSSAHGFLLQQRYQELLADGYNDAQARAQVQQDELAMAYNALSRRRNPAEQLMNLAKARGWQKPVPQQQAADLKTIARGQEANQSLSTAGSSGNGRGKVDAKAVAEMDSKEFEAWLAKAGDEGFRKVMGG